MENLQQITEKICDLYGSVLTHRTFMAALIQVLPPDVVKTLAIQFQQDAEQLKAELLATKISERVLDAYERDSRLELAMIQARVI